MAQWIWVKAAAQPDWVRRGRADGTHLRWQEAEILALGEDICAVQCADCHGAALEGQPDWQVRPETGRIPPPAMETGHTWHHPDENLITITTHGTAALLDDDYESGMMGFGDVLSEEDMIPALSYIKLALPQGCHRQSRGCQRTIAGGSDPGLHLGREQPSLGWARSIPRHHGKARIMLMPRQKTPDLTVPLIGGGTFDLGAEDSPRGTVICFYRGLHCPLCATYLTEFEKLVDAFAERGIGSVAVSSDGEERAQGMADKIWAKALRFGYDLSLANAREWGLYISTSRGMTSIGIEEPPLFAEPGLFLINPDQTLYYMSVQTMPFVRPHFRELLGAVDFAIEKSYPARGEYEGAV